eukprot:1026104-Pelagomonas_calceolata.AAC.5
MLTPLKHTDLLLRAYTCTHIQGTGPSVLRVGLGAGLHFVLLEQLKGLLTTRDAEGKQQLSASGAALSGGSSVKKESNATLLFCTVHAFTTQILALLGRLHCAGLSRAVAAMALCPLTVIKTRMEYTTSDHRCEATYREASPP